jgi:hypothetical protein
MSHAKALRRKAIILNHKVHKDTKHKTTDPYLNVFSSPFVCLVFFVVSLDSLRLGAFA